MSRKIFNPLEPAPDTVQPVATAINPELTETVEANETLSVVCGPMGIDIPAQVHLATRTVTPVLK